MDFDVLGLFWMRGIAFEATAHVDENEPTDLKDFASSC